MQMEQILREIQSPFSYAMVEEVLNRYKKEDTTSFYERLRMGNEKENPLLRINIRDRKDFLQYFFFSWRKGLLLLEEDFIQKQIHEKNLDNDILELREKLRGIKENISYEELLRLGEDPLYRKYGWRRPIATIKVEDRIREVCFPSNYEHSFYLHVDFQDIYAFATLFLMKCKRKDLPYHFEISMIAGREDNVRIDATNATFLSYLNILEEIMQEKRTIFSHLMKPPLFAGKLENFIGYGRNKKDLCYYDWMEEKIEQDIEDAIQKWCRENKETILDQDATTEEVIFTFLTDRLYDRIQKNGMYQKEMQDPSFYQNLKESLASQKEKIEKEEAFNVFFFEGLCNEDYRLLNKKLVAMILKKDSQIIKMVLNELLDVEQEEEKHRANLPRPFPSFTELKELYENYDVEQDNHRSIIRHKRTKEVIDDAVMVHNVVFAYFWVFVTKQEEKDVNTYAFSENAKRIYEYFWNKVLLELKTANYLDSSDLYRGAVILNIEHATEIIKKLFQNKSTIKLIELLLTDRNQIEVGALDHTHVLV